MIVRSVGESLKLYRARVQPSLSFTRVPVVDVLESIREGHFPDLSAPVICFFVDRGPLVCIDVQAPPAESTIYIHNVLNHHDTPAEVIGLICKHELLHILVPPHEVEGRETCHPPEFWEREKALAPERDSCWRWIHLNLGTCLKKRPRLERIDVLPKWRKLAFGPRLSMEGCAALASDKRLPVPEMGGW